MSDLIRKFNCALCGDPLTAKRIIGGWLKTCGCGTVHTDADLTESRWFVEVEA